jgi:hypothetical protein
MGKRPIVDQRIAGTGVEGEDVDRARTDPMTLPTAPRLRTPSGLSSGLASAA